MTGREDLAGDRGAPDPAADDEGEDPDLFPAWFDEWTEPPPPQAVPWYRSIRVLATLIGIAFLALLISTVLLLTLRSPGDFPTGPRITTVTTSPAPRDRTPSTSPGNPTETPTTTPTTTESSESETAPTAEPPADPNEPEPVAPPPRPAAGGAGDDDGPRINVTRSPMSFTPTSVPRP